MKRIALISLAIAATLHADTLSDMQIATLTPIDALPSTAALAHTFGPDPVTALIAIAESSDSSVDVGAQLRAIRSLPIYCPDATVCDANGPTCVPYASLLSLLQNRPNEPTPRDTLRLRATIEAYGEINSTSCDATNYTHLLPFLNNASRDIRAATANALGKLCNTAAVNPLKTRSLAEGMAGGSQQVVLAISAALRDLSFNCPGPQ